MVCNNCKDGVYKDCTCYLCGVHGVAPAGSSMKAIDWYNACNLNAPPTNTTNYLIAIPSHVAIRKGNKYYYH